MAAITYFMPDHLKAGGQYETVTDRVKKVDAFSAKVALEHKEGAAGLHKEISIADILEIRSKLTDSMDDDCFISYYPSL